MEMTEMKTNIILSFFEKTFILIHANLQYPQIYLAPFHANHTNFQC